MACLRHLFFSFTSTIILIILSSHATNSQTHSYLQQELGYDSQAYPSYFSPNIVDDDVEFDGSDDFGGSRSVSTVNVDDFGAKGDGTHDDTQAFNKAWKQACSSNMATFVVPKNKNYLLKPIRFKGPCKAAILVMQIFGTIIASDDRSDYEEDTRHWIVVDRVQNLVVEGNGVIDGNGKIWWQNSCKIDKSLPCKHAPTALTFYKTRNLIVKNIKIQNGQQMHVSFQSCVNVQASHMEVTAPEESPNTDGIHITNTQNIHITTSLIATGDDCISIVSGSQNVEAKDITCGPGHGISIGSLGAGKSEAMVSDVLVDGAKLSGTTNGVRIKTWQGGSGSASNIRFQNIVMDDVSNPIIIDQNYCDQDDPCDEQESAVQVKNVVYQNIQGTSASKQAIKFDCSKSFPCQGIVLQNVKIVYNQDQKATTALCHNVHLKEIGTVSPHCP